MLAGEGTPIDDHRASAAYRTAMLGQALLKLYAAESRRQRPVPGMSALSERPDERRRRRGDARTRARPCTSPATRSTPTTWSAAPRTCCTPTRCRRRTPTPGSPGSTPTPAYDVPGRGPGAHRRRRARRQRRRDQARRAAVPRPRSCSTATRSAGCSARRSRPPGSARRRSRSTTSRCPRCVTVERGDRGRELPGRPAAPWSAATSTPGWPAPPTSSAARSRSPARSTSTSRRTARWRTSTRAARSSSRAAPSTRPRRRRSSPTCSAVHSHEVTVQCLRMGGGFGGKEMQPHGLRRDRRARRDAHRAPGPAAAEPHPGHDDDRQAARLPRDVAGRLRRRRPAARPSTRP